MADAIGRLSGDRGTSVFNYITNFVLLLVAMEHIQGKCCSLEKQIYNVESGAAGYQFMFEGDDWSLLMTPELFNAQTGWAERLEKFYKRLNMVWEPAGREGVIAALDSAFRPIGEGWEFVSQVFLLKFDGSGDVHAADLTPSPAALADYRATMLLALGLQMASLGHLRFSTSQEIVLRISRDVQRQQA